MGYPSANKSFSCVKRFWAQYGWLGVVVKIHMRSLASRLGTLGVTCVRDSAIVTRMMAENNRDY